MKFTNVAAIVALLAAGLCFADPRTPKQIEDLSSAVANAIAANKEINLKENVFLENVKLEEKEADRIADSKDKSEKAIKAILTDYSKELEEKKKLEAKADAIVALDKEKFKANLEGLAGDQKVDSSRQKIILKLVDYEMLEKDNVLKVLQADTKALAALETDFKVEKLAKLATTVGALKVIDKEVLQKVLTEAEITKLLAMDDSKNDTPVNIDAYKTFAETPSWFSLKNLAIAGGSIIGIASLGALVYHFTRENTEEQTDL